MFNISSFLEKFSKNLKSEEFSKQQILDVVEKHTGIKLEPKDIEIKDYIIETKLSPGVKNKLFIHKSKILDEINTLTSKVVDIR